MDEQAERKFCLLAGIKKRFALKEKLAQKNSQDVTEIKAQMQEELASAEKQWREEADLQK